MTEQRRKRANALIVELAAIQAETLEVSQLGEALDFIEGPLGR